MLVLLVDLKTAFSLFKLQLVDLNQFKPICEGIYLVTDLFSSRFLGRSLLTNVYLFNALLPLTLKMSKRD